MLNVFQSVNKINVNDDNMRVIFVGFCISTSFTGVPSYYTGYFIFYLIGLSYGSWTTSQTASHRYKQGAVAALGKAFARRWDNAG